MRLVKTYGVLALGIVNIVLVLFYFFGSSLDRGLGNLGFPQRKLVLLQDWQNIDPVKITNVRVGGTEIQPGKEFRSNRDWFRDLRFELRNRSTKDVICSSLHVIFPETESERGRPPVAYQKILGQLPDHALTAKSGFRHPPETQTPFLLSAGQSVIVSFADGIDSIQSFLVQQTTKPLSAINECKLLLGPVYFKDGTRFGPGGYGRPDPANPGRYMAVDFREFTPNGNRSFEAPAYGRR
jgi:hypothetical protein